VLWKHRVAEGRPAPQNTCASPSPATDGQRVVFLYATGDLVAFDLAGKALWARNLGEEFGKLALKFGYSSSPVFHEGRLYVAVMRRPWSYAYSPGRTTPADTAQTLDSFLLAIDPATGKGLWEADRTPKTTDESYESYASPIPHEAGGRREILLSGGDLVTGHDAATGRLLWVAGWNPDRADLQRLIPSVTVGGGRVYVPVARGGPILAFPAGCTGPVPDARIAWRYTGTATDSSTPLFYDGILYVLGSDSRALAALDPATGRTLWEGGLGVRSVLRASPTGADGKVYCLSQDGDVIVLAAGREQKVLSRFAMGEGPMQASIAAAGGRLYVRTSRSLYCIGPRP